MVFNDEAGQRDCLDKMAVGLLPAAMNHVPKSHIPYLWERKGVVDKNGKTQVNLLNG